LQTNHRFFNGEGVARERDSYVQQELSAAEDQPTQRSVEATFVYCPITKECQFMFSLKEPRLCLYVIHVPATPCS